MQKELVTSSIQCDILIQSHCWHTLYEYFLIPIRWILVKQYQLHGYGIGWAMEINQGSQSETEDQTD